jgi:hypothetical protein
MKTNLLLTLLVLMTVLGGCAGRQPAPGITTQLSISDAANPNAAELLAFEQAYAGDADKSLAARFLLSNLPPADRLSMSAADLGENLDYAFLARDSMPWGKTVPWDEFLHYVLPHRASQEPFKPHRAMLFKELAPLCAHAANMEDALRIVGTWCAQKAQYRPTSRRDLSVISILDAGYGRCEETNILFLAAARAVGLPVRQAMVPWWQHADGNHAWVEAWTPGGWKFLESGTEFSALNQTWFAAQATRMPKVVAHAFGQPPDAAVYRTGAGYALIDNTAAYTRGTTVAVSVLAADNQPDPGRDVFFSVYSMGGLRPVTKALTNDDGMARVILGPGTFFVSCTAGDSLAWTMLDTRDMDEARVTLHTAEARELPESVTFSYPDQSETSFNAVPRTGLKRLHEERDKRWDSFLQDLPTQLQERLPLAGDRVPDWLRIINHPRAQASPWLSPLVASLDDKDLLQAEAESLLRDIEMAVIAREASAKAGLTYDDQMFTSFVLSPRLHLEPWTPWRAELQPWLERFLAMPLEKKVAAIRPRIDALPVLPATLFGPPLTPLQTLEGGVCSSNLDKAVLATAALRCLGDPARCEADFGGVEYFDGTDWQFWEMGAASPASGVLRVLGKSLVPLKDFGVASVEDGRLRPLDNLPWEEIRDGQSCLLPPGDYLLLTPRRNTDGVTVGLTTFSVAHQQTTTLEPLAKQ